MKDTLTLYKLQRAVRLLTENSTYGKSSYSDPLPRYNAIEAMRSIEKSAERCAQPSNYNGVTPNGFGCLNGIKVIEDPMCTKDIPARVHKLKRRHILAAQKQIGKNGGRVFTQHERVQKKWNKRFGYIKEPTCYMITPPMSNERVLVAHPSIVKQLKQSPSSKTVKRDPELRGYSADIVITDEVKT